MQSDSTDVNYAMSVKEALNFLLFIEYCLIIVCISSLVSNSIAIIRLIQETYPIPIMVLVLRLELSEKIILFHAGANAYLEQPVNIELCVAQAYSLMQLYLDAKIFSASSTFVIILFLFDKSIPL